MLDYHLQASHLIAVVVVVVVVKKRRKKGRVRSTWRYITLNP